MATTNWNGGNRAPEPSVAYGQGYDVATTDMQANEAGANAWLTDDADNTHVKLTVIAIETDLRLSGSTGQSQMQRDFYPRNFEQPSFTVTCQARSQKEIGRVAEFVHKAQRNAVSQGSLMSLIVPGGGLKNTAASSDTKRDGMRGRRRGMQATGYVRAMPRSHRRHDPAPRFVFDFVVARMHSGVFQDQPYKVYALATWSEIFDNMLEGHMVKPPKSIEQEQQAEAIREAVEAIEWLGDVLSGG